MGSRGVREKAGTIPDRKKDNGSATSSFTSSSSYSSTDDEATPRRRSHWKNPHEATAIKRTSKSELQEKGQRQEEQHFRTAALEVEIEQLRVTKLTLQQKLQETEQKLQRSEESCQQYQKWLAALAEHANVVVETREALRPAEAALVEQEENLSLFLKEAESFLAVQASRLTRRKRICRDNKEMHANHQSTGKSKLHLDNARNTDSSNIGEAAAARFKPGVKFKLSG